MSERKETLKRTCCHRFHLYEIQKQTKLIYDKRSQISSLVRGPEWGPSEVLETILYLDLSGSYMGVFIHKNLLSCELKLVTYCI